MAVQPEGEERDSSLRESTEAVEGGNDKLKEKMHKQNTHLHQLVNSFVLLCFSSIRDETRGVMMHSRIVLVIACPPRTEEKMP